MQNLHPQKNFHIYSVIKNQILMSFLSSITHANTKDRVGAYEDRKILDLAYFVNLS